MNDDSNGTLGLYTALGKLGYNPCHMKTVLMGGAPEVRMMKEVVMERHSPNGKRYNKDDLNKWLGQYDVSLAILVICLTWRDFADGLA